MDGLNPTWDIEYMYQEEIIIQRNGVIEWLLGLTHKVKINEESEIKMRKWFKTEQQFIHNIVSVSMQDGFYVSLVDIKMRESNDYLQF